MKEIPQDLPDTLAEFEAGRHKAADKYRPLVRKLNSIDFLGLLTAVEEEVKLRNAQFGYGKTNPDPGTKLGNR